MSRSHGCERACMYRMYGMSRSHGRSLPPMASRINISLYVDVKARVCSECIVKILIKAYKQK